MPDDTIRLLLGDVEVEVLQEALDLYVRARPRSADRRYDYRYRVAQGILDTLSRQGRIGDTDAPGDDELPGREERGGNERRDD